MADTERSSHTRRRREREREARIASIREAGARVFARHGYRMATMDMVAREAELGKASLYYYYKTKQDLFADIVSQAASDLSRGLSSVIAPRASGGQGEVAPARGAGAQETHQAGRMGWERTAFGAPGDVEGALAMFEAIMRFSLDYFSTHRDLLALALPLIAGGPKRLEEAVGRTVADQVLRAHAPVFHHLAPLSHALPRGSSFARLTGTLLIGLATKVLYGSERDLEEELNLFMRLLRRSLRPDD